MFSVLCVPVGHSWPVALGTGVGMGFAASTCQHDFKRVASIHLRPIKARVNPSNIYVCSVNVYICKGHQGRSRL